MDWSVIEQEKIMIVFVAITLLGGACLLGHWLMQLLRRIEDRSKHHAVLLGEVGAILTRLTVLLDNIDANIDPDRRARRASIEAALDGLVKHNRLQKLERLLERPPDVMATSRGEDALSIRGWLRPSRGRQ